MFESISNEIVLSRTSNPLFNLKQQFRKLKKTLNCTITECTKSKHANCIAKQRIHVPFHLSNSDFIRTYTNKDKTLSVSFIFEYKNLKECAIFAVNADLVKNQYRLSAPLKYNDFKYLLSVLLQSIDFSIHSHEYNDFNNFYKKIEDIFICQESIVFENIDGDKIKDKIDELCADIIRCKFDLQQNIEFLKKLSYKSNINMNKEISDSTTECMKFVNSASQMFF